jgi:hypothetical protein
MSNETEYRTWRKTKQAEIDSLFEKHGIECPIDQLDLYELLTDAYFDGKGEGIRAMGVCGE